jgi:hypothetical protein
MFLEKLTVAELFKKFTAIYVTRKHSRILF